MTPEQCKAYKGRLLALRNRLRGDVERMMQDASAGNAIGARGSRMPIHMAEIAGENFEQELSWTLASSKEETLDKIERALERIEAGEFGTCDLCRRKVSQARLEALPYAELCVRCAKKNEEDEAYFRGG